MRKNSIYSLPVVILSIYIATQGFIIEWNGCDLFTRAIGHTGIFLFLFCFPFIVSQEYLGSVGVGVMSIFSSLHIHLHPFMKSILQICGVYIVSIAVREKQFSKSSFEFITSIWILFNLPFDEISNYIDAFALSGHMTLCVVASQHSLYTKLLALFSLSCCILVYGNGFDLILSLAGIVYIITNIKYNHIEYDKIENYWPSRTLWQCNFGISKTIIVLLYAFALYVQILFISKNCENTTDISLHAIHIGGIITVCIFIVPQVSPSLFKYASGVVFCASFTDFAFTFFRLLNQSFEKIVFYIMCIKSIFALLVGISMITLNKLEKNLDTNLGQGESFQSKTLKNIRLIGISLLTMAFSYISYLKFKNQCLSFFLANLVHDCIIIIGFCVESILSCDRLSTRAARILAFSKFMGEITKLYVSKKFNVLLFTSGILSFICTIILPWNTINYKNVVSFDI